MIEHFQQFMEEMRYHTGLMSPGSSILVQGTVFGASGAKWSWDQGTRYAR